MITNPPQTGNSALDAYLLEVKRAVDTAMKPFDGWKLSDFQAPVSEVISDKRDLIDIVRTWGELNKIKADFSAEVARYEKLYADSKVLGGQYQDYASAFTQVMDWWAQSHKTIEEARALMERVAMAETAAEKSANNAKTSETNAKGSETRAKTSETNSKTSETNSKTSETNSKASETNAKTSETNAIASEGRAKTSETNTLASEGRAKTSETNAKGSETRAKTSETNSKTSETKALEAANRIGTAEQVGQWATKAESAASRAESAEAGAAAAAATEVNKIKAGAPEAFDTLLEIANELNNNQSERAALANSIAAKADKDHVHPIEKVTGLQAALNGKSNVGHSHSPSELGVSPVGHKHISDDLTDATAVGKAVLKAASTTAARTAIGAGTSSLTLGVTSSTAAAGDHKHTKAQITDLPEISASSSGGSIAQRNADGSLSVADPINASEAANKRWVEKRKAFFSGAGNPPSTIPGAVIGDWWLNETTMELFRITGV